ncbi:phospholipase C, phosphocholine-specific [Dyadobacter chenwenxiniae]|uniref:phospholipase C n=1 Tax=Dyadobacter chenwenxiniae TaxID=2906456 RepID=A0A9X1PSL2_9BACT|nr:phospholipase C, phosphocholine-specific [Dyadobacter chenwenxiniae]MCF0065309.1 phospholipase C, phosphocholine-specific [Dyadobacter chenwenxiniae]UON84423.1 phospholipase C, phosphocholine-specific [Dyadobacter chenwenxiniae]
MDSRRDFLKKAALLTGTGAMANMLPPVIQRALAINPEPGSTFYDAEHVVFLMLENRSFDHQLGTLQGVRGFNDPRAIDLPNKNKVWFQSNSDGDTYGPFHLNVKDTKIAWMGSIPHGWTDQTDAMNDGKYDRWLDVKKPNKKEYAHIPLTMGYCDRNDFPFYYSLADAFTVCDHNFCSSITGTHPNRYYWMSGTVREKNEPDALAHLWNISNYVYPELDWKTYPERLEENGIPWKVYQNEITMGYGLKGEESSWLSNFGTNVLEYFKAYNVRFHEGGIANLQAKKETVLQTITELEKQPADESKERKLAAAKKLLANYETAQKKFNAETFAGLSQTGKNLNTKAFTTNISDTDFQTLTPLQYSDNGTERILNVPKGDIFHQFRKDVEEGTLPAVSWLMPPARFSDHPGEPWFGPWYVSEVMEILLKNPEVWKKTIFVLTYDENDGYFDHMPPYTVPNPYKENTGKVSAGIDPKMDFATKKQQTNPSMNEAKLRDGSIGLGYRVPMIIASPWTRGGFVNSEIFDHTSSLQFLENFIEKKFGKNVREENITNWRRTICGDLTSVFRPYNGEKMENPAFLDKNQFIEEIHQSQFRQTPDNFKKLSLTDIKEISQNLRESPAFPTQEKGIRPACALPYELYSNARFDKSKNQVTLSFKAGKAVFGEKASGAPFRVYAVNAYQNDPLRSWDYSAAAGDTLTDEWNIGDFAESKYHLRVYGPNGFFREFRGDGSNPLLKVTCLYQSSGKKPTGNIEVLIENMDTKSHQIIVSDNSYKTGEQQKTIAAGGKATVALNLSKTFNWYDFSIKVKGSEAFEERFAGHVETGDATKTDPLMGGIV